MMRALLLAGVVAWGMLDASASQAAVVQLSGVWSGSESIQGTTRLLRDAMPSQAGTQKAFPGTTDNNPTYFSVLDLLASSGTTITITETATNANNSFFSIYDTSFSPLNLATNYLGDAGSSGPNITFSVLVPTSGMVEIVASSVNGTAAIGQAYSASISYTASAVLPTQVPEPASLALLGMGVTGVVAARRRRAA